MKTRLALTTAFAALALASGGCRSRQAASGNGPAVAATPAASKTPGPLPDAGWKAQLSLPDAPAKLRAGEKTRVNVHVRNASDVSWWARGGETNTRDDNKFYLATGDRWLKTDGSLVTDMDGRYGIGKDLKPGEETEVPLLITAPKEPGDYLLEVDLVQEQVGWFSDKGSPTAKAKVTVVR